MLETNFVFSVPDVVTQLAFFVFMAFFGAIIFSFVLKIRF